MCVRGKGGAVLGGVEEGSVCEGGGGGGLCVWRGGGRQCVCVGGGVEEGIVCWERWRKAVCV